LHTLAIDSIHNPLPAVLFLTVIKISFLGRRLKISLATSSSLLVRLRYEAGSWKTTRDKGEADSLEPSASVADVLVIILRYAMYSLTSPAQLLLSGRGDRLTSNILLWSKYSYC
jgi:hypothetical protein